MKQSLNDHSFHKRTPSFRKSVKRTIDKLSELVKFEVPISMTFKEIKKKDIEVRLSTRLKGRHLVGIGHGKNPFSALKNARKALFCEYEQIKKRYNQRVLRAAKTMDDSLPLRIEATLTPTDTDKAS